MPNNQLFISPSEEVDEYLGFRINDIEHDLFLKARDLRPDGDQNNLGHVLHGGHQTWVGLDPQTLNTPYSELKLLCDVLKPKSDELMVDLGAGYGRLGVVLAHLYPEVQFLGYELVEERVQEGNRIFEKLGYEKGKLMTADLTHNFKLPVAQYYFIYDYGKVAHIRQTLKELEALADNHSFTVIARGKGVQSIIEHEHPWLADIYPIHREEKFSIYSMTDPGNRG
ncbi:methyltransferase [Peredibacter sp. HCB2-198]|uniref:methyltransferase n=1 Tax=Peredibacter sp. HCB2-198 TaxID=3383025 RepID=UPI0038B5E733